jgi:hypothetical protein
MRIAGRPFAIIALAALAAAGGLWALAGVAGFHDLPELSIRGADVPAEVVRALTVAWAVMALAAAPLLLALHRWGWELAMLTTGIGLLVALWSWWLGVHEPVRLVLLVITAFYLNGREVRGLLRSATDRASAAPLAPPEGGLR